MEAAPVVTLFEGVFGVTYSRTKESHAVAARFDFVARAAEIAGRTPQPAVLLVAGARDDEAAFREPAATMRDTLVRLYADPDRVSSMSVPEMAHALAEPPGVDPAPQTLAAERVDAIVADWFRQHLGR